MPRPSTKKKGKAARSTKRSKKRGPKEDVKSSTSLPPAVEGPLRCFLRVAITKVTWTTPKLPDSTHVRLRWWGETASGTTFRPVDGKNQGKLRVRLLLSISNKMWTKAIYSLSQ
nr:C2 domain-containing protein 3-like [Lytechinus pictus]